MLPPNPDAPAPTPEPTGFAPLLAQSSGRYVGSLRDGALFVLVAMVINLATTLGAIGAGVMLAMSAPASGELPVETMAIVEMLQALLMLVAAAAGIIGWWWLTTRDPQERTYNEPSRSRPLVRTAVLAQAVCLLGVAISPFVMGAAAPELSQDAALTGPMALAMALGLGDGLAMIVKFFASMSYLRWIASRIPDETLEEGAARFMWMGPFLIVGVPILGGVMMFFVPLIIGLGVIIAPLIALVMYWNLIFKAWKGLSEIAADQRDEAELLAQARRDTNLAA